MNYVKQCVREAVLSRGPVWCVDMWQKGGKVLSWRIPIKHNSTETLDALSRGACQQGYLDRDLPILATILREDFRSADPDRRARGSFYTLRPIPKWVLAKEETVREMPPHFLQSHVDAGFPSRKHTVRWFRDGVVLEEGEVKASSPIETLGQCGYKAYPARSAEVTDAFGEVFYFSRDRPLRDGGEWCSTSKLSE